MLQIKKISYVGYLAIVLSSLVVMGCGGGSSGSTDPISTDNIIIDDGSTSIDENLDTDDNSTADNNITIDDENTSIDDNLSTEDNSTIDVNDFPDAVPHDPSFTSIHFSGSQNCAQCHDGIRDSNGTDVSIVKAWQGTMMANAATDPLWKAKVATEVKEHPEFKQTIEAKCSRCHTPMATVEATFDDPLGDTVSLSGDGFFNHKNFYYDSAIDGVSCTLCHQIENTPALGTAEGFSGDFQIADNTGIARKIYGPYQDPKEPPMQNSVQFTPVYSQHIEDSKLCASCHNLDSPVISTDGSFTNFTFPEQAAYTEWEYSDFNGTEYSCQYCHMPKGEGSVVISTRGQGLQARANFHQHKFLGANTYMLEILKNNRVKLGVVADETKFDESITDTREFLKAAADVNITDVSFEDGTLDFSAIVTNYSGHKFPTGFPSRRVWLHVTVKNSINQIVFESGALNSKGQIIGVDDTLAPNAYEPHYDKIDEASQVQVYETILSDTDDNKTYILLHALHYLKDNRILPRGFDKNNVPESINPHGNAVNDSDFIGGSDTIEYEINNLPADDYTVTVTLNYQTLSYGFAQDMYKNTELPEVALMKVLDANASNRYETVSTDTASSFDR